MKLHAALKWILVLFLFTGISCEKTTLDPSFTFGTESTFRLNQLYTSSDGHYTLKITEIADSRCPTGVECIWQGEVSLKGTWTANKNKSNFEVHTEIQTLDQQPAGYNIRILDVKPYPKMGVDSKPAEMVVTLFIQPYMNLSD